MLKRSSSLCLLCQVVSHKICPVSQLYLYRGEGEGEGGAESVPLLGFFPNNSKTPQNNEMKFCHFKFTPLGHVLHTLTIPIVLRCCHGKAPFVLSVSHHFLGWKNEKTLTVFKIMD